MALTTLASVKEFMDIPTSDTSLDAAITTLIPRVDRRIKSDVGRSLEARTGVIEFISGKGLKDLLLKETPVTAVATVHEDNDGFYGQGTDSPFGSDSLLTVGDDFALVLDDPLDSTRSATGILRRLQSFGWPDGDGNIKVTYDSGFATLPDDIALAATMQVAHLARKVQAGASSSGPIESEKLGAYMVKYAVTVTETDKDLLPEVVSLLAPYKRWIAA